MIDTLNEMVCASALRRSPLSPVTTSPRRLPLVRPGDLRRFQDMPSLLAVSNCRSSCSQVLSAFFFSCMGESVIFGRLASAWRIVLQGFQPCPSLSRYQPSDASFDLQLDQNNGLARSKVPSADRADMRPAAFCSGPSPSIATQPSCGSSTRGGAKKRGQSCPRLYAVYAR